MMYILSGACDGKIQNCCNDMVIAKFLNYFQIVMTVIQIAVPIILIVSLSVQLFKMAINPEEKNGMANIYNKIKSILIVFFLPTIVNASMNLLPDSETFNVGSCWREASKLSESISLIDTEVKDDINSSAKRYYLFDQDDKKASGNFIQSNVDPAVNTTTGTTSATGVTSEEGSAKGKAIVDYALSFVGNKYVWGGTWNGERPYTGTDCSGFVQGVFKHNGINLTRTTSSQWDDKATYELVTDGSIKPGDLVMYKGHVAILTGNGNQIVHAANSRSGVIISKDYKKAGCGTILGIMRIKGVN